MATKLEKDITRESKVVFEDRNVMITLTADQKIVMKRKGMKSGAVEIGIEELYCQLAGCEEKAPKKKGGMNVIKNDEPKKGTKGNPMISLYDLRSQNAISTLDVQTMSKFDGIIKNVIEATKNHK